MESQQDIVDLTINDGDDCFFLTGPPETAPPESVYGSEDGEITAKQNQEDDTLSCYGSEDGEIVSKEEEKEEDSKKIIFKRIWPNFGKKPRKKRPNLPHSMFTRAAIKLSIQGEWKGSVWDSK